MTPSESRPSLLYVAVSPSCLEGWLAEAAAAPWKQTPVVLADQCRQALDVWGCGPAALVVVDGERLERSGSGLRQRPDGLWEADAVEPGQALNSEPGFAERICAGTVLIRSTATEHQVALIRVSRAAGETWELPKGHLEPGEQPLEAGLRETREELGLAPGLELTVLADLPVSMHAFRTPEGKPRLKTTHWFLVRVSGDGGELAPQRTEGVVEVAWLELDQARQRVSWPSLHEPLLAAGLWLEAEGGAA